MNNLNKKSIQQRIQWQLLGGRRFWGFMFSFLLLWACESDPADPKDPENKKPDASKFGFTLLKITDVKEISVERLKKQLKSDGDGWTIKSIKIDDESFAEVTGTLPNLKIILKKSGSFTASITLQKEGWQDFVLKDCKFEVVLPKFSFSKFTHNKSKKTITSAEILKQIAGAEAAGYSIKSIVVSDENFAKVSGTAPKLQIDIQKVGKFTATIVLSHKSFFEITLKDCAFEIVPEFVFDKLTVSSSGSKTITAAQILGKIAGAQAAGYTIKSIVITEDAKKLATANGTSIDLDLTKAGVFKATVVLQKGSHADITLKDCAFEIVPGFIFSKLTRSMSGAKTITAAEILGKIAGAGAAGYTIKSIAITEDTKKLATANGTSIDLDLTKAGVFKATVVLQKDSHADITLKDCAFEISSKKAAPVLSFKKLTRRFSSVPITKAEILSQITVTKGQSDWAAYVLKSIVPVQNGSLVRVNNSTFEMTTLKAGTFRVRLTFERDGYVDAVVMGDF